MKWKILVITPFLFGALALGVYRYADLTLKERDQIKKNQEAFQIEEAKKAAKVADNARSRIVELKSLEDWENFLKNKVPKLSGGEQKTIANIVKAKIFEARFHKSERLLTRARALLEQDNYHPVGKAYIEDVRKTYENTKDLVLSLKEIAGDPDWNARLEYFKGIYYYRSLLFVNIKEDSAKAKDLITQSFESFKKALEYKPKDRDIEVAIELLQKNTKDMLSASAANQEKQDKIKLKLLPGKDREIEGPIGGPSDQERGRH